MFVLLTAATRRGLPEAPRPRGLPGPRPAVAEAAAETVKESQAAEAAAAAKARKPQVFPFVLTFSRIRRSEQRLNWDAADSLGPSAALRASLARWSRPAPPTRFRL